MKCKILRIATISLIFLKFFLEAESMMDTLSPGIYVAALTPLNQDLSCNHKVLADHSKQLIEQGCQGIVLFGTTGEGTSFSVKEKQQAIREIIQLGIDPSNVIVGVSCCSIDEAVQLIQTAQEYQCAAVLIVPPFFFKNVTDTGVIQFYREIIHRCGSQRLKIILYHIPQYSGVPITLNVIKTLLEEFPNQIVGIKDSADDFQFTEQVIKNFPSLKVFVGKELHIFEAVRIGGAGSICGIANILPKTICSIYNDAKKQNAETTHSKRLKDFVTTIKQYPFIPAMKAILTQKDPAWQLVRPPLETLAELESRELKNALATD